MIDKIIFCSPKAEDFQPHQVNNEDISTEEHQGDKLEDCCCQCTGLSFLIAMRKNTKNVSSSSSPMMLFVAGCYCCCSVDKDTAQGGGKCWFTFRRSCNTIAQSKCFDVFMIVIIFLSSFAMVNSNAVCPHVMHGCVSQITQVAIMLLRPKSGSWLQSFPWLLLFCSIHTDTVRKLTTASCHS